MPDPQTNSPQKLVKVDDLGVVAFPGHFDDSQIIAAIRSHKSAKPSLDPRLDDVAKTYPALAPYLSNVQIKEGKKQAGDDRGLEFYPPWESRNPNPGKITLELFDKMQGPELTKALGGDLLHYLGSVDPKTGKPIDPKYHAMKQAVLKARTPQQEALDKKTYDEAVKNQGEKRPYDQWLQQSRLDAYIRGYVTPELGGKYPDEWRKQGQYQKPEMLQAVQGIQQYVTGNPNDTAAPLTEAQKRQTHDKITPRSQPVPTVQPWSSVIAPIDQALAPSDAPKTIAQAIPYSAKEAIKTTAATAIAPAIHPEDTVAGLWDLLKNSMPAYTNTRFGQLPIPNAEAMGRQVEVTQEAIKHPEYTLAPFVLPALFHGITASPVEKVPKRFGTRNVHSNPMGEVRVGADQVPTVWLSPKGWEAWMKVYAPGENAGDASGMNIRANDAMHAMTGVQNSDPAWGHVQELLKKAHEAANAPGSMTVAPKSGEGTQKAVRVLREEKNHSWQRSLAANRKFVNHLSPQAFTDLRPSIPGTTSFDLLTSGYQDDPAVLVSETAAKYLGGDLNNTPPEAAAEFLGKYFDAVTKEHGPKALETLEHTRGIASKMKEKIYAEHGLTQRRGPQEGVGSVPERGQAGSDGVPPSQAVPAGAALDTAFNRSAPQGEILPSAPKVDQQAKREYLAEFAVQKAELTKNLQSNSADVRNSARAALQRLDWMTNNLEVHNKLSAEPFSVAQRGAEPRQIPSDTAFNRNAPDIKREAEYNNPDNWILEGARNFARGEGRDVQHLPTSSVDFRNKDIADAYEAMKHDPKDPKVRKAYDAMKSDIDKQWNYATKQMGIDFEPSKTNPYANSAEMVKDVKDNNHLSFYQGGDMPADHPLADVDPKTGLTYNDKLRAIHDLFGHAMEGFQFGPKGEENAWIAHSQMFSSEAIPALTTETKGQNSWVNAGPHLRDAQGDVIKPGQPGYVAPDKRPFAEQKAGLLPQRFHYRTDAPISFISPNTLNLSLTEAQQKLSSAIQKRFSGMAGDLANALGLRPSVRPILGSWQGGAENSVIHQFPVGTDPDAVRYYNSILGKLGYQNATGAFFPGEGQDHLFAFWADGNDTSSVAKTLLDNGLENSTIEPSEDGHVVYLVGSGDDFRGKVDQAARALGHTGEIEQYAGTAEFPGNYDSRDAAARDFSATAEALESKHPEWKQIREGFESRPDTISLHKLIESTKELAPEPEIGVVHYSNAPDIERLDPSRYGENKTHDVSGSVVNRPDLRRKENFPNYWSPETYAGEESDPQFHSKAAERFAARQFTYKGKVGAQRIYDMTSDPDKIRDLSRKELEARNFKKLGVRLLPSDAEVDAYAIKRLKDLGYSGRRDVNGLIASWEDIPVKNAHIPPAEDISQHLAAEDRAFRRERIKTWNDVKQHLTDEEKARYDSKDKQDKIVAAVNAMPRPEEWDAAVKAGVSGRLWYERSSRAFDALVESQPDMFRKTDKNKFLNFVSALSPVQPVRANLLMAINLWDKWNKAGRPVDVIWKDPKNFNKVANKNSSLYRILKGGRNTYGVDLPARLNNGIRALQDQPLSGPKVSAFAPNLGENTQKSTNDTWMAIFGNVDPNQISQPHLYDAMSAAVREAGEKNGIPPRQSQAAIWSFIKSLAELSGWGKDRWIPPQQIIEQGLLTPELINKHAADFADLLANDNEIRDRIKAIGGNLDALDRKLTKYVPARPEQGTIAHVDPRLLNAAERLETARSNARIQSHLERKSENSGLFDTSFEGNDIAFRREKTFPTEGWYSSKGKFYPNKSYGQHATTARRHGLGNNYREAWDNGHVRVSKLAPNHWGLEIGQNKSQTRERLVEAIDKLPENAFAITIDSHGDNGEDVAQQFKGPSAKIEAQDWVDKGMKRDYAKDYTYDYAFSREKSGIKDPLNSLLEETRQRDPRKGFSGDLPKLMLAVPNQRDSKITDVRGLLKEAQQRDPRKQLVTVP